MTVNRTVMLGLALLGAALLSGCGEQLPGWTDAAAASPLLHTAAVGSGYAVNVVITDTWSGGFNGAVRLKNTSGATITRFEVVFKLSGNASVSGDAWAGSISAPDAQGNRTAVSPGWLNPIAAGASFDLGFPGSGTFSGATIVSLKVNGQAVSLGSTPPTTPPPVNPPPSTLLTVGSTVALQVATPGFTSRYLRHSGALGVTEVVGAGSSDALKGDANWKVVAGLADANCVSFESANTPGQYLRHAAYRLRLDQNDNGAQFKGDATFCLVKGLDGAAGTVSLASKNNPSRYIRHRNAEVWLDAAATDTGYKQDASWTPGAAWTTDTGGSTGGNPPTGTRLDNPFTGAKWYVNQEWAAHAKADGGAAIAGYNTAVWMDRIGAIAPTTPGVMGLRGHLDAALRQGANLFTLVIYDLPNRDCFALASNGELRIKDNGFNRYKTEYITPLAQILADPKYKNIRIVAVIEPDSLPNLVTNTSDPDCQEAAGAGGYVEATQFTLNTLYNIPNVYSYIDIGHSGWLGWDSNFSQAATLIAGTVKGTAHGVDSVVGFISNTANTTPTTEPFLDAYAAAALPGSNGGTQIRQAKFYEWNPHFNELGYVQAWRKKMIELGFPSSIGMLIDTSRNGWGGPGRPSKLSTSTDVDTFVNESRVDRRTHRGMWCNQASGIGERPSVAPAPGVDAYVWIKPPGESDGVATAGVVDPTDPAKGFDRFCDPTYTVPSNGQRTGALPNAPHAGRWFSDGFKVLLKNAYPPLP